MHDIAQVLQGRGHSVVVVTATPTETETGFSKSRVGGIPVLRLATSFLGNIPVNPLAGPRLLAAMRGADVVHIHTGLVSPFAWHGLMLARRHRLPTVVTWHSVVRPTEAAFIPFIRPLTSPGIRHSAPSTLVAGQVQKIIGDHGSVAVIPNGVELSQWRRVALYRSEHPRASRPAEEPFHIVAARRLAPRKRTLEMLEVTRLAREMSGVEARLTIYGEGPQRAKLESWIRAHDAASWAFLPGRANREELMAAYAHADIYLSTSRLESFGIATLEARAAGLPVVTPRGTGADDFLVNGVSGLLGETDHDVAAQLALILADDGLRGYISEHNEQVEPAETWERVAHLTENEYAAAISEVRC